MENDVAPVQPPASVNVTVTGNVPVSVGVPDTTPLPAFPPVPSAMLSPVGSPVAVQAVPASPLPLVSVNCAIGEEVLYATPKVSCGTVPLTLIVGHAMVSVNGCAKGGGTPLAAESVRG